MNTLKSRDVQLSGKTRWLVVGAGIGLVVASVLVVIGALSSQSAQGEPASPSTSEDAPLDMSRRLDIDPTALGSVDAPVVLIEYADYRCPFCGVFARDTLPDLVDRYVESGDLRIEWRDLPIFGDDSMAAAVAARAAGEQGRFWEFHEVLYAAAPERGHPDMPREKLLDFAETAGVPDLTQFERDLENPELNDRVLADVAEATSLGASSTPLFLINGVPVVGAQPTDVFRTVIENAIEDAA